jgi:hypothetical protein
MAVPPVGRLASWRGEFRPQLCSKSSLVCPCACRRRAGSVGMALEGPRPLSPPPSTTEVSQEAERLLRKYGSSLLAPPAAPAPAPAPARPQGDPGRPRRLRLSHVSDHERLPPMSPDRHKQQGMSSPGARHLVLRIDRSLELAAARRVSRLGQGASGGWAEAGEVTNGGPMEGSFTFQADGDRVVHVVRPEVSATVLLSIDWSLRLSHQIRRPSLRACAGEL